ncbi:MAG: GNAT family N-acetyltransferase [Anaerolineae bacterium]|nr:GNAT family N-acetyltransferase [Anaerolineae bacterium]
MANTGCAGQIELYDGRQALVRPLRADDVELLSSYFAHLSETSRRFYGPHRFDRETAERLCADADEPEAVRFVALLEGNCDTEMIGYMILSRDIGDQDRERYGNELDYDHCACLAPSIADAYQNQGLGTRMARHVLHCAKAMGLRQVILMGGVVDKNLRARRLYERLGFRYVRKFWTHGRETLLNHDMVIDL